MLQPHGVEVGVRNIVDQVLEHGETLQIIFIDGTLDCHSIYYSHPPSAKNANCVQTSTPHPCSCEPRAGPPQKGALHSSGQRFPQDDPATHWWPLRHEQNRQLGVQWSRNGSVLSSERKPQEKSPSFLRMLFLRLMLPSWNQLEDEANFQGWQSIEKERD